MDIGQIKSEFTGLITAEMVPIVAAVYGICYALKHAKFFDDRFIPIAALLLGIILEFIVSLAFAPIFLINSFIRGCICGMAAVYVANIVKQAKCNREN